MTIEQMSTADLVAALRELVKVEKRVGKDILFHLLELDRRGMFVEAAYTIATYCIEELGMDERSAGRRAKAVGMMKRFPIVIGYLREEALTMSTLELLDGVLTDANASEVLEAISYLPEADVRVFLTCEMDVEMTWRMVLHIGRVFQEKLDKLRELASHMVPSGSAVELIELAMDRLIVQLEKRRHGSDKPTVRRDEPAPQAAAVRRAEPSPNLPAVHRDDATAVRQDPPWCNALRRYIPVAIRREVWTRDRACCTYVSPSGRRCCSRRRLEFHHIHAFTRGGPPTVDNITLHCKAHNHLAAERDFGRAFMAAKRHAHSAPRY